MSETIMTHISLRCLSCGMQQQFDRDKNTPGLAVEMVSQECPACSGDEYDESCEYRDASGRAIRRPSTNSEKE